MSHRISLPLVVLPVNRESVSLEPVSRREFFSDPSSASLRYRFVEAGAHYGPFDPWKLREEFLRNETAGSWEGFFVMAGPFYPGYITHADFTEWQRLIKEALVRPAKEWRSLAGQFDPKKVARLTGALRIVFNWAGEVPVAKVVPTNSLEGIIASVQVDALQGTKFGVCARHDCKSPPFRLEARHKIYCCPECAHLVAVRNSRERAAKAKKSSRRKKSQIGNHRDAERK